MKAAGMENKFIGEGIRGLLFDLDGTLYRQGRIRMEMMFKLLAGAAAGKGGLPMVQTLKVIYSFRRQREGLRDLTPGRNIERLQYEVVARRLGLTVESVERVIRHYMHEAPLACLRAAQCAGVKDALLSFKRRGLCLGVYSDYPPLDKIRALGLEGIFDVTLSSEMPEIDAFKPNPRGFVIAARKMGLKPSEIMYVGDRVNVDMEGAARAGMRGALVTWKRRGHAGTEGYYIVRDIASLEREMAGDA